MNITIQSTDHTPSPLLSLPYELLRLVYVKLDPFSINNLLEAIPALIEHFLVVSDGKDNFVWPCAMFWDQRVNVCSFKEFQEDTRGIYASPHLIALFDVEVQFSQLEACLSKEVLEYIGKIECQQGREKGKEVFSVLYYQNMENPYNTEDLKLLSQLRKISNNCYSGHSSGLTSNILVIRKPDIGKDILISDTPWQTIRVLQLTDVHRVHDLNLQHVIEITIRLSNDTSTPSILRLWAPKVEDFSIYYWKVFPRFRNTMLGTRRNTSSAKGTLRLIQVDALKELDDPLPPCETPLAFLRDEVDFSTAENFQLLQIIGGHDELLFMLADRTWDRLVWKRANLQPSDSKPLDTLKLNVPYKFSFETLVPDTSLPTVNMLMQITIDLVNRATGFKTNGFFMKVNPRDLRCLRVHSFTQRWPEEPPLEVPGELCYQMQDSVHVSTSGNVLWGASGYYRELMLMVEASDSE